MREPPPSTVPPLLSAAGAGKKKAFDRTESILALTLTSVTSPVAEYPAEGARRDR